MHISLGSCEKVDSGSLGGRCVLFYAQSCLTLCDPMDCGPPGSSVHGLFQARILAWVAISYSRGSSRPRGRTSSSCVSCIGRRILYHRAWGFEFLVTSWLCWCCWQLAYTWSSLALKGITQKSLYPHCSPTQACRIGNWIIRRGIAIECDFSGNS